GSLGALPNVARTPNTFAFATDVLVTSTSVPAALSGAGFGEKQNSRTRPRGALILKLPAASVNAWWATADGIGLACPFIEVFASQRIPASGLRVVSSATVPSIVPTPRLRNSTRVVSPGLISTDCPSESAPTIASTV